MSWADVALGALVLLAALGNLLVGIVGWHARDLLGRVRRLETDSATMAASLASLVDWLRHTDERRRRHG